MRPDAGLTDHLVDEMLRTAIGLKRGSALDPRYSDITPESRVAGKILARFLGTERKVAEAAYAALEEAGLQAEALGFNAIWHAANPGQEDLWVNQDELNGGNHKRHA